MLNPYVMLALGIAWILSMLGADQFGYHRAENAAKAAQTEAIANSIAEYDAIAQKDKETAVRQASVRAAQSQKATVIRNQADEAIRKNPLPASCDWDADSFARLQDAVQNAADHPPPKPGVSNPVSPTKPPSKPQR